MNNDEFLNSVAWYQGVAAGIASTSGDERNRLVSSRLFWMGPWYFALAKLARQHPEDFAKLVDEHKREACERYGAKDWDEEEPAQVDW